MLKWLITLVMLIPAIMLLGSEKYSFIGIVLLIAAFFPIAPTSEERPPKQRPAWKGYDKDFVFWKLFIDIEDEKKRK